jgi:hypothetical protein
VAESAPMIEGDRHLLTATRAGSVAFSYWMLTNAKLLSTYTVTGEPSAFVMWAS